MRIEAAAVMLEAGRALRLHLSRFRKRGAGLDFLRQWVGVILVVAGLARAFVLVAHDPLVGYANQHDMHRTSACIGLFPVKEAATPFAPTAEAPLSVYRLGSRTTGCYLSSEVAIAATVVAAARAVGADVSQFRLQWICFLDRFCGSAMTRKCSRRFSTTKTTAKTRTRMIKDVT